MRGSSYCPDCPDPEENEVPPANYNLRLYADNAEVQAAFPHTVGDNSVYCQSYCYPHYVAAYNRFHPTGGIRQQWKDGYIGQWIRTKACYPPDFFGDDRKVCAWLTLLTRLFRGLFVFDNPKVTAC